MSISSFPSAFENLASFDPKNCLQWNQGRYYHSNKNSFNFVSDYCMLTTGLRASKNLYHLSSQQPSEFRKNCYPQFTAKGTKDLRKLSKCKFMQIIMSPIYEWRNRGFNKVKLLCKFIDCWNQVLIPDQSDFKTHALNRQAACPPWVTGKLTQRQRAPDQQSVWDQQPHYSCLWHHVTSQWKPPRPILSFLGRVFKLFPVKSFPWESQMISPFSTKTVSF